jgi:hypothetical protein
VSDVGSALAQDFQSAPEHATAEVAARQSAAPAAAPAAMPALTVGAAGDAAEHEADRMADAAIRRLDSVMPRGDFHQHAPGCGHDATVRRSAAAPGGAEVGLEGGAISPELQSSINGRLGKGSAMDHGTRGTMEKAFGRNFSDVRVHDDPVAHRLSRSVAADAFTVGKDVFFAQGKYDPSSQAGEHMLAHELGHVVQGGR